jgi:hypothetical protein
MEDYDPPTVETYGSVEELTQDNYDEYDVKKGPEF